MSSSTKDPLAHQLCLLALKESNIPAKDRVLQIKHISKKSIKSSVYAILEFIDNSDKEDIIKIWDCSKNANGALNEVELIRLLGIIGMKKNVRTKFDTITRYSTLLNESVTDAEAKAIKDKIFETFDNENNMDTDHDLGPVGGARKRTREMAGLTENGEQDKEPDEHVKNSSSSEDDIDGLDANTKAIFMKINKMEKKMTKRIKKSSSESTTNTEKIQKQLTEFQENNKIATEKIKSDLASLSKKYEDTKEENQKKFTTIETEIKTIKDNISPIDEVEYMEYRNRVVEAGNEIRSQKNKLELLATSDIITNELLDTSKTTETGHFHLSDQKVKTYLEGKLGIKIAGYIKSKKTFKINDYKHSSILTFSSVEVTDSILENRKKLKSNDHDDPKKNASVSRILPKNLQVGFGKLKKAKADGFIDDVVLTKGGVVCVMIGEKRKTVNDRFEMLFLARERINEEDFQSLIDKKKYINSKLQLKKC